MPTRSLLRRTLPLLIALLALLSLGAMPASADGPLSLVRTVPIPATVYDIDLQGSFMYVATGDGLTVVDMSGATPVIRGSLETTSLNMGVTVRGQYAYLASFGGGFRVVDISNPDAPVVIVTRAA